MPGQYNDIIISFKRKSRKIARLANFLLLMIMLIMLTGSYFIFISSDIAARDIERHRIAMSPDANIIDKISGLKIKQEQIAKDVVEKDVDLEQEKYHSAGYVKFDYPSNMYGSIANDEIVSSEDGIKRLLSIKSMLSNLLVNLESTDIKTIMIADKESLIKNGKKQLNELELKLKKIEDNLEVLENKPDGPSKQKTYSQEIRDYEVIKEEIGNAENRIKYAEVEIEELRNTDVIEKFNVKGTISAANEALGKIDNLIGKIQENITIHNNKINELASQSAGLHKSAAMIDTEIKILENQSFQKNYDINKDTVAFIITANAIRIGVVVLTIFFAHILLSIYKYASKLFAFYESRADMFSSLDDGSFIAITKDKDQSCSIDIFFTPNNIDFGNMPHLNNDQIIDIIKEVIKK